MSHGDEIDRLMESDPIELVNRLLAAERETERLREALEDFAQHGTRHDLNPTHVRLGEGPAGGWEQYIARMDDSVRQRAAAALAASREAPS